MAKSYGKRRDEAAPASPATWLMWLGFLSLAAIVLLFTPYTNNLDEIKVTLQYWIGPTLILLYLWLYTQGYVRPIPKIPFYCIVGYLSVMVVSIVFCQYPWLGLRQFGFQFSLIGFFLVMAGTIINRKNLHDAVWFFVMLGFATSLFGFFHYFGGFNFLFREFINQRNQGTALGQLIYTMANTRDMLSTILNRDFFASFLVFLFPLAISAFIVTENVRSRIFIGITAMMMFFCFYLGVSKDSFGAFGVSMTAYVLLYWKFCRYKRLNVPYWWVWALGLLLWMGTIMFMTWDYFSRILHNIDTGIESRSIIWGGGIGIWLDSAKNFIIGSGPGHFRVLFPAHRSPDYFLHEISNVTIFAHNRYIDLLAEEGLVGFLVYMALIATIFWYKLTVLLKCKDGDQRVYQLGVLSSLLGLLLANIFSPNVRWTVVAVNFWAVLGLGIGNYEYWKWGDLEAPKRRGPLPVKPAFAGLMALCGVVMLWSWYYGYVHFAGAYFNNEGIKKMDMVERSQSMPPQDQQRNLLAAIENFNRATDYNPTFLTSYYKGAHCYNQLAALSAANPADNQRYQLMALDAYKLLQVYAKDYAEVHYNLGIVNYILHGFTKEEKYLKESLLEFIEAGRQSNKIVVQYRLAESYEENGQIDDAIRVLERIATLPINPDPDDGLKDQQYKDRAPYSLLELYLRQKQYEKAEGMAMDLFERWPGDNYVFRQLMVIYRQMGATDKSIAFLERILGINPAHIEARQELSLLLEAAGNLDGAMAQAEMVLYFEPANATAKSRLEKLRVKRNG